jgi:hypothetical protein
MLNAKVLLAIGVAGLLVYLATKDGKISIVAGESYYGGGGRCYRLSDDEEVPTSMCTERGEDVGTDPNAKGIAGTVTDAFQSGASKITEALGSLFGGAK